MMMVGLISALLGLAVAYFYSSLLGALLFLVGTALLARGYLQPDAPETPARGAESSGPVTYNISSGK